jgi:type II secretory pathway component PulF
MFFSSRWVRQFSRQLAMLLEEGVPLFQAVELVRLQQRRKRWSRLLTEVRAYMREGTPLSGALRRHGNVFRREYIDTLKWAESTGSPENLAVALRLLAGDVQPRSAMERIVCDSVPRSRVDAQWER